MSSSSSTPSKRGVDALLTSHGRALRIGEEIRFTLVKGPNYPAAPDPVNPKAPLEQFPLIAKFPESVVTPNLQEAPWNTARLYQQDVPKAQEDSDEELEGNKDKPKKRWRPRKEVPKRQWVLQNQVEFLENMMAKRQRKALPKDQVSTRYEGVPEHNPSQYILLEQQIPTNGHGGNDDDDHYHENTNIQVTLLPTPFATITFSQPKARKTLSMSEAEMAIQDQRGKMTRFMMHDKQRMLQGQQTVTNESRKRLFGKLTKKKSLDPLAEDEDEDEDVMGDIAFRNRKGSGRARKELLNTLGDSGIKVDQDGVLGGNNDSEFGRGQRFGRFNAENSQKDDAAAAGAADEGGVGESTRGNDGLAMADDFYQRDVGAEYEELDFDANEQFDDDDVDVGEREVAAGENGFAGDDDDDDDDDDEENADGEGEAGPQGLANLAMFRLMLAKARGEITPEQAAEAAESAKKKEEEARAAMLERNKNRENSDEPPGHLAELMKNIEKIKDKKPPAITPQPQPVATSKLPGSSNGGVEIDENGQRLITLEAVRREIWLQNGTISTKRLIKIFNTKGNKTRQTKFMAIVKELCTMETDPVHGRMFVLKQHYSNMG